MILLAFLCLFLCVFHSRFLFQDLNAPENIFVHHKPIATERFIEAFRYVNQPFDDEDDDDDDAGETAKKKYTQGRAVSIVAPAGSGKSTVLLPLLIMDILQSYAIEKQKVRPRVIMIALPTEGTRKTCFSSLGITEADCYNIEVEPF